MNPVNSKLMELDAQIAAAMASGADPSTVRALQDQRAKIAEEINDAYEEYTKDVNDAKETYQKNTEGIMSDIDSAEGDVRDALKDASQNRAA